MIEKSDKNYSHSPGMGNSHSYSLISSEWECKFPRKFHSPHISEKNQIIWGMTGNGESDKNIIPIPREWGMWGNLTTRGIFIPIPQFPREWGMGLGIPGE